jgi:predicted nucleic acid-binding protein
MRLLDTDVLIDVLRNRPAAVNWFAGITEPIAVPGFVAMELYQGCRDSREVRDVDRLLAPLDVVWPSETDCGAALAFFPARRLSHGLGLLDALIAATALGRDATLCTLNTKHFSCVSGLTTEQPYTP